jgi:hypothetical protein
MKSLIYIYLILFLFPLPLIAQEESATIIVGHFSPIIDTSTLPKSWEPLNFKNIPTHTIYSVVQDNKISVIKAESDSSSSGLIKKVDINPIDFPFITWKWKVSNIYQNGDVNKKSGDDFPARIYITFAYDGDKVGFWEKIKFNTIKLFYGEYPPIYAINYIWANKATQGLVTPNPFTDRVKMIVIESGEKKIGTWAEETRNISDDFRSAFGEKPLHISGIAIMTDSDNTGESAIAWYGDIFFSKTIDKINR